MRDPDVAVFGSNIGSGGGAFTTNSGRFFIVLKPRDERASTALQVIDRLRPQLAAVKGGALFLQPAQDITVGGRLSRGQFQYTLQDANIAELGAWSEKMLAKMRTLPQLADASTDLLSNAPQLKVTVNRDQASRFGITPQVIDDTLNDAFGQRQVTQYFTQVNTYWVILEVNAGAAGHPVDARAHLCQIAAHRRRRAARGAGRCRQHARSGRCRSRIKASSRR